MDQQNRSGRHALKISRDDPRQSALRKEFSDTWLRFACDQVGGTYQQGSHVCFCETGHVFRFWVDRQTAEPSAVCEEVKVLDIRSHENDSQARFGTTDKKMLGNIALTNYGFPLLTRGLSFSFPFSGRHRINRVWLESNLVDTYLKGTEDPFSIGEIANDFFTQWHERRGECHNLPHVGNITTDHEHQFFVEPHFERDLKGVFETRMLEDPSFQLPPQLLSDSSIPWQDIVPFVLDLLKTNQPEEEYLPHSQYGCAEFCEFSQEWKNQDPGFPKIRWEKSYLSGAVHENRIFLIDPQEKTLAQFFLDPLNRVSIFSVYRFPSKKHKAKFNMRHNLFFDRTGRLMFENESLLPRILDQSQVAHFLDSPHESKLAICEQGFPTGSKPGTSLDQGEYEVFQHLSLGPYKDRSFFGWFQNPTDSSVIRFSGADQIFFAPGRQYLYPTPQHATEVSLTALREGVGLQWIVPIGTWECISRPQEFETTLLEHNVKVVNLSSVFPYDAAACEALPWTQYLRDSKLLWVSGTGNGRERVTRQMSYACPTNIHPMGVKSLIIAVAGMSNHGPIHETATYGEEVGDIVASGQNPGNPRQYAASYAVPRVSAVAARLAADFPKLSPQDIRLSILLGAFIPPQTRDSYKNDFMDVRSGGGLDLGLARKAASILSQNSELLETVEGQLDLLRAIHCEIDPPPAVKRRSIRDPLPPSVGGQHSFQHSSGEEDSGQEDAVFIQQQDLEACRLRVSDRRKRLLGNHLLTAPKKLDPKKSKHTSVGRE